jgi:hypothetical protein
MDSGELGLATSIWSCYRRVAFGIVCAALVAAVGASPAASASERPCKLPGFSSVKFVYAVVSRQPRHLLRVRDARVICGGPDDVNWGPVGGAHTVPLAATAQIRLLKRNSVTLRLASLAQLTQLSRLRDSDTNFGWFGGAYGVRTNSSGEIHSVTELFHP